MQDDIEEDESGGDARPFWSGTVAFGLLSLPVHLFLASRRNAVPLRLLDEDGTPLSRRYFCSKEDELLDSDELVRGYEVRKDEFVEVSDEELEAIAPEKSREINLRRFVPLQDIDPLFFERAYFLVPEEGAQKAYRLLAASMANMGRAGIATFVMREKEYLVAIISDKGILRAETLRFIDEIRTPQDVGLPPLAQPDLKTAARLQHEIKRMWTDQVETNEFADDAVHQLQELVEKKLEEGDDVVHPANLPQQETAQVIDLMQILKRSLEGKSADNPQPPAQKQKGAPADTSKKQKPQRGAVVAKKPTKSAKPKKAPRVDENTSKAELYELAKELHIPGRSQMSREELITALRKR